MASTIAHHPCGELPKSLGADPWVMRGAPGDRLEMATAIRYQDRSPQLSSQRSARRSAVWRTIIESRGTIATTSEFAGLRQHSTPP
jgi:hypothetical protein